MEQNDFFVFFLNIGQNLMDSINWLLNPNACKHIFFEFLYMKNTKTCHAFYFSKKGLFWYF